MARDLHDVVAHNVSVMVVQAGAARHALPALPEQAVGALQAVEAHGREAMTDLRLLRGLLDHDDHDYDDEETLLTPQPGVGQLEALAQRMRGAGLSVALCVEGHPRPLPPGLDLTVYRIVQEALTDALEDAVRSPTDVLLDYRERGLLVDVRDDGLSDSAQDGPRTRGGHRLVRMRERVTLYGGTLEAGPRPKHGYAVRVWLPLNAHSTSGD